MNIRCQDGRSYVRQYWEVCTTKAAMHISDIQQVFSTVLLHTPLVTFHSHCCKDTSRPIRLVLEQTSDCVDVTVNENKHTRMLASKEALCRSLCLMCRNNGRPIASTPGCYHLSTDRNLPLNWTSPKKVIGTCKQRSCGFTRWACLTMEYTLPHHVSVPAGLRLWPSCKFWNVPWQTSLNKLATISETIVFVRAVGLVANKSLKLCF